MIKSEPYRYIGYIVNNNDKYIMPSNLIKCIKNKPNILHKIPISNEIIFHYPQDFYNKRKILSKYKTYIAVYNKEYIYLYQKII